MTLTILYRTASSSTFRDDDVFAADRFEEMDHSDEVSKQPPLRTVRAKDVLAQIGLNFIANKNPSLLATRSLAPTPCFHPCFQPSPPS